MMLARQPGLGHARQDGAHDAAHGILCQGFVVDVRLGRHRQLNVHGLRPWRKGSGGLLLPGALRTAPDVARRQGFKFRLIAPHYAARAASA